MLIYNKLVYLAFYITTLRIQFRSYLSRYTATPYFNIFLISHLFL